MDETFKAHAIPFSGNTTDSSDDSSDNGQVKDEGGRPKIPESQRKTDKNQSNNNQPRAGVKGTLRGNSAKKPNWRILFKCQSFGIGTFFIVF